MKLFLLILPLFFVGCYSKCGITKDYYCDCKEYYNVEGTYHKECPKSLVDIQIGVEKQ